MSTNQVFNGVTYPVPTQSDLRWAPPLTRYLVALGTYAFSPAGGSYPLTASLDLSGHGFGVLADYFSGPLAGIASQGRFRMTKSGIVAWRNNAGSGDNLLAVDGSDNLTWNGTSIPVGLSTLADGKMWIGSSGNLPVARTLTGDVTVTDLGATAIGAGKIVDAQVSGTAAIAYSKLSLTGSILNADIYASAAIAYSKLNLTGSILNVDINSSAAIAYSKLALSGSILNADISASAAIDAAKIANGTVSSTEFQFLDGVTSAIQTQINSKQATGNYITALTGDVTASGPGSSAATLATVNANVGSFTLANITVDGKGRITAAANGSAGAGTVTSVSGTANQISVATGTTTPVISITSPVTFPGAMTAGGALAMASNKITGLANGTSSSDAAAFGQIYYGFQAPVLASGTTTTTLTSGTLAATVITAAITPTSSSHRIKITASFHVFTASNRGQFTIERGTTNLMDATGGAQCGSLGVAGLSTQISLIWIDSPSSTSSVTYTVYGNNADATGNVLVGNGRTWTLILEEIV